MEPAREDDGSRSDEAEPTSEARVVYLQPPVQLGRLIAPEGDRWRVSVGGVEQRLAVDPSVEDNLLRDACERAARVIVDATGATPVIAGVLMTRLPLTIDGEGRVRAEVEEVVLEGRESVTLISQGGMVHLEGGNVELYGREVLTRARELAKVLARMISLN